MKFTIAREPLLAALDRAKRAVDTKGITSHARITASANRVTIDATDLTLFVSCSMPADVKAQGEIGVAPAALADMVRRMPDGAELSLTVEGTKAKLAAVGTKRAFQLAVIAATDLPTMRGASHDGAVPLDGAALAAHLRRTIVASYDGGDRANCHGVALHGLRFVATDGVRLAVSDLGEAVGAPRLLHLAAAKVLASEATAMGDVGLVVDEFGFSFTSESVNIFVPHVASSFVPYEMVLPKGTRKTTAVVDVKAAIGALQAMATVAESVALSTCKALRMSAKGERDSAEDEVEATVTGPAARVHLDTSLMLDAIRGSTEATVTVGFDGDLDPVTFTSAGYHAVVMPQRAQ